MTRLYSLGAYAEHAGGDEEGTVVLRVNGATPVTVAENLGRLRRLGLLSDEAIWGLVGRAPIDPLGVYGALVGRGDWRFSPSDLAAVRVLVTDGATPVAIMRVDLVTNEIVFQTLEGGQLEVRTRVPPEHIEWELRTSGRPGFLAMVDRFIDHAVAAGLAAVQ